MPPATTFLSIPHCSFPSLLSTVTSPSLSSPSASTSIGYQQRLRYQLPSQHALRPGYSRSNVRNFQSKSRFHQSRNELSMIQSPAPNQQQSPLKDPFLQNPEDESTTPSGVKFGTDCPTCGGASVIECVACNGEGFVLMDCETMWMTCKECIGLGEKRCKDCSGGFEDDDDGSGAGKRRMIGEGDNDEKEGEKGVESRLDLSDAYLRAESV